MNMKCMRCNCEKFYLDVDAQKVSCSSCGFYFDMKMLVPDNAIQKEQKAPEPADMSVLPDKLDSNRSDDFEIIGGVLTAYKGKDVDVVVPDGVLEIGTQAFKDMSQIRSIYLPEGVRYIRREAFWGCKNLCRITIPTSVEEFEYSLIRYHTTDSDGAKNIRNDKKSRCFWGCVNLMEIVHGWPDLYLQTFEGTAYVENRKKSIKDGKCPQCGEKLSHIWKKCDNCKKYWNELAVGGWGTVVRDFSPAYNIQGEYWD